MDHRIECLMHAVKCKDRASTANNLDICKLWKTAAQIWKEMATRCKSSSAVDKRE